MRRPLSGRKHFANIIVDAEKNEEIQKTKQTVDIQPKTTLHVVKDGVTVRTLSVSRTHTHMLIVSCSLYTLS
jgi:3-polyprenyl-4-hydroxybenzoate decarboxylase